MFAAMPPDAFPPDDAGRTEPAEGTVVDPTVLAERRAQRAEVAERSAVRRAADAQSLAAELAHERARLEAERDAARAEAAAAREGADAVKVEARHLEVERDALRRELEQVRAEHARMQRVVSESSAQPAPGPANGTVAPTAGWVTGFRRELARSRATLPAVSPTRPLPSRQPSSTGPSLARERQLVAQRAGLDRGPARAGERATPVTELALERERSTRLQVQLDESDAVERGLRERVAALEDAVGARRDAEARIENALRRVRAEFDAAQRIAPPDPSDADANPRPGGPAPAPEGLADAAAQAAPVSEAPAGPGAVAAAVETPPVGAPAPTLDSERLNAARDRLRAEASAAPPQPAGPPAPWLPDALRRLTHEDPATAGRIAAGIVAAQGLVTQRPLRYDLALADQRCVAVDVGDHGTEVRRLTAPRARREVDFRVTADEAGLARLLYGHRRLLRRRARVQGSHRRLRELRKLAREPLALRDLGGVGAAFAPALALRLAALALDPAETAGSRFTIAHAPLAGGPADAWLRIRDGQPPVVLTTRPGEPAAVTVRCTRGALLPLLAGVTPPPGEGVAVDGDRELLDRLRAWIAATEFPAR
jgi:hypothetical protein